MPVFLSAPPVAVFAPSRSSRSTPAQCKIRLQVIEHADNPTLQSSFDNIAPDTEAIYTDELPRPMGIEDADTRHEWVNHSREEWVVGDVHANGIESVWSFLKRSIIDSYRRVSSKHVDAYLDELEHRF